MRVLFKTAAGVFWALLLLSCQKAPEPSAAPNRGIRDGSAIPAALAAFDALPIKNRSLMVRAPSTGGKISHMSGYVEIERDFIVDLAEGDTFGDVLHGVFAQSQAVVARQGGTIARPWTAAVEAGLSYVAGAFEGRLKIKVSKDTRGVRVRLWCREERR